MARARPIPGLSADEPFALAAARVVAVRAAELDQHSRGVLDLTDIERVHDMRVATRRLRAALEVFAACFPRQRLRPALRELKALADALGERRDRDVMIAELERVRDRLPPADRPGVESLIAALRDEQLRANAALAPAVAEDRLAKLRERLADLVGEAVRTAAPVVPEAVRTELEEVAAGARRDAVDGAPQAADPAPPSEARR